MCFKKSLKNRKYDGVSLVEMLITMVIMVAVLLVTSVILITLIKASAISSARTLSRNETEFLSQLLQRYIENSEADEIHVYSVTGRTIDADGNIGGSPVLAEVTAGSGDSGNEIQFRPIDSDKWICIAMYCDNASCNSNAIGYVVKSFSSAEGLSCLDGTNQVTFITADTVDLDNFEIQSYVDQSGNYSFIFDVTLKPIYWIPGRQSSFKPEYTRQLILSTGKLTY
ncbi:hypothetical protein H6764_01520 [Candidatus Nomurabacteria bacterium]|nr:hypothetical protein [Candidatus Nomurabacteria bacterium]